MSCSPIEKINMIRVNNKRYVGQNITISNNKVIVDGQDVTPDSKEIFIHVEGHVNQINADIFKNLSVNGTVGSVKTQSGDVGVAGSVMGDIKTMSGDVKCDRVSGKITTMSGDIKRFK